ncbi:GroES-like protein [Lojkania enalia]|uniref:GroES-like protein n=1 Tax=Lojkania enalia TaxID=147567 RepID=A0A9P4K904_9PLEO|nr:GroES-like protein [Didymosphaeria enalia]
MKAPKDQAAYLIDAGNPLEVRNVSLPTASPGKIVVKNATIAINPLDYHQQDHEAGELYEVGPDVSCFKNGDRFIGHTTNLITGRPQDGKYQLYTTIPADKAAILPDKISFSCGIMVPFAIEIAPLACHSLRDPVLSGGETLVVFGTSSLAGNMTTRLATAAGVYVIDIAGAVQVVEAVCISENEFFGIFDAISIEEAFEKDLAILWPLGGGYLVLTHPSVGRMPASVKASMRDYVTPALEVRKFKYLLPPSILSKGLGYISERLKKLKAGVSGTKLAAKL